MYLSAVSMVAMAMVCWRAIDVTRNQTEEISARQRAYNYGLVTAIKDLAEQSGMLTSADYCPVRFRVRHSDGGIPARGITGVLERILSDGDRESRGSGASSDSGLIEFGLLPPGRYRLHLESQDGMVMEHEFDVLPGVPVDRVVICPYASPPDGTRWDVQIVVDWPARLESRDILAIIEIEPGPFVDGDWRWEPAPDWPCHAIATTYVDSRSPRDVIQRMDLDDARRNDAWQEAYSADAVAAPYHYCQVRGITFFHRFRDESSRERFEILGAFRYGEFDRHQQGIPNCWEADSLPPQYSADPVKQNHWTIDVPSDCVHELVRRIQEIEQLRVTAT